MWYFQSTAGWRQDEGPRRTASISNSRKAYWLFQGAECQLRRLRREGIQLHIDDFGTGYSSGFDLAQGFFLSRPLAAEAVPGVILEGPQADAGAQNPVRR